MQERRYGGIIIEEKGHTGLSPLESVGLVVVGAGVMALAFAVALAIVQLSLALSVSVVAVGLGLGGSLGAQGVAQIILARGQARALEIEARRRADVEIARASLERERLALERERLRLEAERRWALPGEERTLVEDRSNREVRL